MSPSAGARLRLRIDCEASGPLASQDSHVAQKAALLPVTASQPQAVVATATNVGNEGLPSVQSILDAIALKCFKEVNPSIPEELDGYLRFLKEVRNVLFVDAHSEERRALTWTTDPDEVLHSTTGKANFQRITRLLISGGTSLLREIFDAILPPSNLPTILSNSATKKLLKTAKLTKPQWDCLYPSPGVYGKSADFDVTLLFRLLRTICGLAPPSTGWDALPATTDHSLTADLARVKHYRNSIYGHVNQGMEIKDCEFLSFWQKISEALVRIAWQIGLAKKTAWQGAIDNFLNDPLTVEDERNVQELEKWYKSDMEVKKSIKEVLAPMNRLDMDHRLVVTETRTQEEAQDIKELKNTTRKVMDMVCVEAQDIKDQIEQMHQSIDRLSSSAAMSPSAGARLRLRIDCEALGPLASQDSQVAQKAALLPVTASQPQAVVATAINVGNEGLPSVQSILNAIALKYFKEVNPSIPEELDGCLRFLKEVRNVLFADAHSEEHRACRENFLKHPGDLPASIMDTVTSEGGEVIGENIKLVCPPGAVDNPLSVNITLEDPSKYFGLIVQKDLENDVMFGAPVICLQPNGHFFKKPVKLTTTFRVKNFKCDSVLILHGTEARDGKVTWQDISHNSKIDEASAEIVIEMEHFSRIVVLLRWTLIRTKDILSRLNLLSFNYTLSLLLNKSSPSSVHDELALLFVSQDVYHEQFYREEDETSALVQLKKQGFKELHVRSIDAQGKTSIYNSETLQVNIDLGEDYNLADIQHENIRFNVDSYAWWNEGKVMKLPLEWKKDVRILWGKITLQGEFGHTSKKHFSERDLCGYARRLLGVEGVIFNVTPIAQLLQMPEESMNQVTKSWQDEDEQLDIILKHWLKKSVELDVPAALRKCLEGLNQEDYRVTQRGQMHIRHLREIANKISGLQCVDAVSRRHFSCKVRTLCKSVLRDCCIELEGSAEGVERAASSSNHADYLINHFIENHQPIPDDIAQKYKGVCSEESSTKTFLAIVPHLIQNIKEIFVDDESIVPQNGLRGLSEEKVNHFLLSVRNAQRNNKFRELVYEECEILGKLCLKNHDKKATEEIEEWGESLEILQMLKFLKQKQFFQHCRQDVRLHKRLGLFSRRLKYILTDREDTDKVFIHDFSNVLQSLIHFAKFDPSKLVRFELFDSSNTPLTCRRENVKYDKHGNAFSQSFDIRKESEDGLQVHAIAYVSIDGRICKKGAFQSVIMLNASGEEAFDTCMKCFDVAVMKIEDKSSGNLRLVLCSMQKEELEEALDALKRELSEDLLDSQSEITHCHLQMRSTDPPAAAVLSLRLEYRWGSEAVTLDSKDFVTFAEFSAGGACKTEGQLVALMAECAAPVPLTSFDQLRRHGRLHGAGNIEYHLHQTVNQMSGNVCLVGNNATVNEQMPIQRALQEGPSDAPKRSITDGKRY